MFSIYTMSSCMRHCARLFYLSHNDQGNTPGYRTERAAAHLLLTTETFKENMRNGSFKLNELTDEAATVCVCEGVYVQWTHIHFLCVNYARSPFGRLVNLSTSLHSSHTSLCLCLCVFVCLCVFLLAVTFGTY